MKKIIYTLIAAFVACTAVAQTPLAMAYVPYQEFEDLYDASAALENGTLFKNLNFPFERGAR